MPARTCSSPSSRSDFAHVPRKNTGWRAPIRIRRRNFLNILIASMSSPDAPITARLAELSNAQLRDLAAEHGLSPRLERARYQLVRELTLALRDSGAVEEAGAAASGAAGGARESEDARVAQRYFVALRAMVDENLDPDDAKAWCRSDERAVGLREAALVRLRNFWAWMAAQEMRAPEQSGVVKALARKPRF